MVLICEMHENFNICFIYMYIHLSKAINKFLDNLNSKMY